MQTKHVAKLGFGLFLTAVLFSFNSLTSPELDRAEAAYQRRGEGFEVIHTAREAFFNILKNNNSTLTDKRVAVDRIGRLAALEGELAPVVFRQTASRRGKIFAQCMKAADYLEPNTVGRQTPEYYYWKSTCMALRAAYDAGYVITHIGSYVDDLMELIETGIRLFPAHDGAGFHRLKAAIYIQSKNVQLSGLYRPQEALQLADHAIEANGEYMVAFLFKAQALVALRRKGEAITLLKRCTPEFTDKIINNSFVTIPNGIENQGVLELLNNYLAKIQR